MAGHDVVPIRSEPEAAAGRRPAQLTDSAAVFRRRERFEPVDGVGQRSDERRRRARWRGPGRRGLRMRRAGGGGRWGPPLHGGPDWTVSGPHPVGCHGIGHCGAHDAWSAAAPGLLCASSRSQSFAIASRSHCPPMYERPSVLARFPLGAGFVLGTRCPVHARSPVYATPPVYARSSVDARSRVQRDHRRTRDHRCTRDHGCTRSPTRRGGPPRPPLRSPTHRHQPSIRRTPRHDLAHPRDSPRRAPHRARHQPFAPDR